MRSSLKIFVEECENYIFDCAVLSGGLKKGHLKKKKVGLNNAESYNLVAFSMCSHFVQWS